MITRVLIYFPLFSTLIGYILFKINLTSVLFVENIFREPVIYIAIFLIPMIILIRGKIKKKLIILFIYLFVVLMLSLYSLFRGIDISPMIASARTLSLLVFCILVGYYFIEWKVFFKCIKPIVIICVFILFIEFLFVPAHFWEYIGFTDYFLYKQEMRGSVTGHSGYYNANNITHMYQNFDIFNEQGIVIKRYGGLFGQPIEFGHFFSALSIIIISPYFSKGKYKWISAFLICLIGFFLIGTKGYIASLLIYLIVVLFYKYRVLRIPVAISGVSFVSIYIYLSFVYQTSAMGHVVNLFNGLKEFLVHPLLGAGIGSSSGAFDDSFLARLLVEGGIILPILYFLVFASLYRLFIKKKSVDVPYKLGILFATFIPPVLTGAAMHFLSIFFFGYLIGLLLREPTGVEVVNG